ncbi:MAG: hypothetical protein JW759_05930 [Candidatus Coatesbacteria bacterium]|nr:hypothetical protein [Candidatus Coatesbacteria bacterium]
MQVIVAPLKANTRINAREWYKNCLAKRGEYELPYDDDCTALLYQFFLMIMSKEVPIEQFASIAYLKSNLTDSYFAFNHELVFKFTREVSYRLDEILQDVGDQDEISGESMLVFHHHDSSTHFHGDIIASNVATSGGSISSSSVQYTSSDGVVKALRELIPLVNEVVADARETVKSSLDTLLTSAGDNADVSVDQVRAAAEQLREHAPTIAQRLSTIASNIGTGLAASAIYQGLMAVFG